MSSLNPVRGNVVVIPRFDIAQACLDARIGIGAGPPGRQCWNAKIDLTNYKAPLTSRLGSFLPAQVVSIGPAASGSIECKVGDIVGLDVAQVLHEIEKNGVANWIIPGQHILCKFNKDSDLPVAVGKNVMTVQDQEAQDKVRREEKSQIVLVGQEEGILSAGGTSHQRISFERITSVGNDPTFEEVFGPDAEVPTGDLAVFATHNSTVINMFPKRYRVTAWSKLHATYGESE